MSLINGRHVTVISGTNSDQGLAKLNSLSFIYYAKNDTLI